MIVHPTRLLCLVFAGVLLCGPLGSAHATHVLPLRVEESAGVRRLSEPVVSGVPFPAGLLKSTRELRLTDAQGRELPLQAQASAAWRDGSVKWALLDFQADLAPGLSRDYSLQYGNGVSRASSGPVVKVEDQGSALWFNTGPLKFAVSKTNFGVLAPLFLDRNGNGQFEADERIVDGLSPLLEIGSGTSLSALALDAPQEVSIEEPGPLRAVVKIRGWFAGSNAANARPAMEYVFRIHAFAGSSELKVHFTATHKGDTNLIPLSCLGLDLRCAQNSEAVACKFGGSGAIHEARLRAPADRAVLSQRSESSYDFVAPAGVREKGARGAGWALWQGPPADILLAVRDFWQQYPKALLATRCGLTAGLYSPANETTFDWDQGLAKTHELLLSFNPRPLAHAECGRRVSFLAKPLFAVAPAPWYCDSKVFGDLAPFDFDLFPDYETLTEASGDLFIKRMATGFRNWGDFYYGGPYKGKNSFMNLEYDVHHNFFCQFARTTRRKYLEAAIAMARHQADIDTNHKTHWPWKHSPRHVEIQAEFGHTFTRGLLECFYLTGDQRCREAALELGDFFAQAIRNPRELGNERQIGWSLISLLPVYEATWDRKYFEAAHETLERLMAGLDARGKFAIRWDNRIPFFNGIAATGFIYFYRATGDERVAEAALKVIRRAKGMYPEYNGRTLEALAWAYQKTADPDYLDLLKLTYETTLARAVNANELELGAPTIFTVHALPFLARAGFVNRPDLPLDLSPAQFDSASGLHAHHYPAGDGEAFFQARSSRSFHLVVIRKGAWKCAGEATLFDPAGAESGRLDFPREAKVWQRQTLRVDPARPGAYRLALRTVSQGAPSPEASMTWDLATSVPLPCVLRSPDYRGLEKLMPCLCALPSAGATNIDLALVGQGEGFKKAVVYDPEDRVAGSLETFIDLDDKQTRRYTLSVAIPRKHAAGLWRISLQDVSLAKLTGLSPYFSTSPQSHFDPTIQPGTR